MANLALVLAIILAAAALISSIVYGINRWPTISGKVIAVGSGLLLLALVLFVALVVIIVVSAWAGHPF